VPKKLVARIVPELETLIYEIRGQRVMLDSDLARIYGVPTFRFNEAIKRNRERFPKDFAFQLTREEFRRLISQIAISSSRHGGRRRAPSLLDARFSTPDDARFNPSSLHDSLRSCDRPVVPIP
jgi:ORF6N domain